MSFRRVVALAIALSVSAVAAQEAKQATPQQPSTPAADASAATNPSASSASSTPPPEPAPATVAASKPGDPAAGQGKAAACGACHGMDGNATDPQYPKLAGQHEAYIVHQLESFKNGKRQNPIMMGFSSILSEQDMHDIGAYFASKTSLPSVADEALVAQGEKLYRQGDGERAIPACMACHSIDGRGNPGALYPQLGGQHAQYIEARLKAYHGEMPSDLATVKVMQTIALKLDDKDIAAVASYIEGLHAAEPGASPTSPSPPGAP